MTVRGIIKGGSIVPDAPLPWRDGQVVRVSVEPECDDLRPGSAAAILRAVHQPPHVTDEDVDALLRAIEEGKLPTTDRSIFDVIAPIAQA